MKTNLKCLRKTMGLLPVLLAVFFLMGSDSVIAGSRHKKEPVKKWEGYLELLGKPGTARSLGQTDLFVPLAQDENDMTFFNQRSQIDDNDQSEHNFGLGHRHMFDEWIIGGYGYYDTRNSAFSNNFSQVTFGVEALSENFDFRANGYYVPDNDAKDTGNAAVIVTGNQVSIMAGAEKALPGFDGEIGYKLPVLGFLEDTRLYVGGYHFIGDNMFESVSGPRARLEARVHDLPFLGAGSRLMMGVETQYDDPRGSQTFGLVSVRIPFGVVSTKKRSPLKGLDRRMMQPVVRDVDIVTGSGGQNVDALNPAGDKYDRVMYWKDKEDMENQLAERKLDETILGVMVGKDGEEGVWNMDGFATEGEGGGVSYVVAGKPTPLRYYNPFTGTKRKIGFTPNGITPTMIWGDRLLDMTDNDKLENGINISLFTMLAGDHINGWDMDAEGFISGLRIDKRGDYYITNAKVSNADRHGVWFEWGGTLNIEDSTISDNGRYGLFARYGSVVNIEGSEISGNLFGGAKADTSKGTINIKGSKIIGNGFGVNYAYEGGAGVDVVNNGIVTIKDSIISGNRAQGVWSQDNGIVTIKDSIISGNEGSGLVAESWGGAVSGPFDPKEFGDIGSYVRAPSQIIANNVEVSGNGSYGVLNRGGRITLTNSPDIFDNGEGSYFNQTGILIKPNFLELDHRDHCIVGGGTLEVDGVLTPGVDLIPLPDGKTCLPKS